jgi:hypothetical protein
MKKLYTLFLMALITFTVATAQNQQVINNTKLYNAFTKKQKAETNNPKQDVDPVILSLTGEGGPYGDGCLFDTIYFYDQDSVLYGRYMIAYDANAYATAISGQEWTGSAWGNIVYTEVYVVDGNGNNLEITTQEWNGSSLQYTDHTTHTYDIPGNMLTEVSQGWNGSTWLNTDQIIYTYDGNGNMLSILYQTWDGSAWVNSYSNTRTFDLQGQVLTYIEQSGWLNNAWEYTYEYRNTNTYDGNNNRIEELRELYNGVGWQNDYRATYTYDGNDNLLTFTSYYWDGSAWIYSNRNTSVYDGNDNPLSEIFQGWDVGTNTWQNSHATFTTYCSNDCFEATSSYNWNVSSSEWELEESLNSDCSFNNVGINENTLENSAVNVYPNPTANNLTVETEHANGFYQLQDISGRTVMQGSINTLRFDLNISALGKGIYILNISNKQGTGTKKIAKE